MALVNLNNLSKRIGGTWALWDVTLEIDAGEILGVFGRSGSGKSTLASIVAGLDQPTSGCLRHGNLPEDGELRPSIGLQRPAFAPELTVFENLEMFASLWGVPRRLRVREISFLLELLELAGARSSRAGELSGGSLQRLEIARALVAGSPLTIIDCLLDALDPPVFEKLWDHLLAMRRSGRSVMALTASARVAEVCQRISVIHRGRIGFVGRPDDFRRLAGEDVVVLGDMATPEARKRVQEKFSIVVREEDGFLTFRVSNGERMVSDLLAEFGGELSCVYLKRPTLDDALDTLAGGGASAVAGVGERQN